MDQNTHFVQFQSLQTAQVKSNRYVLDLLIDECCSGMDKAVL